METTDCGKWRERFADFLVEPESVPREASENWSRHLLECAECAELFGQERIRQDAAQSLVARLARECPSSPKGFSPLCRNGAEAQGTPSMPIRVRRWKKGAGLLAAGVFALLVSALCLEAFATVPGTRPRESSVRLRIAEIVRKSETPKAGERFLDQVFAHVQATRREFEAIRELIRGAQESDEKIPLLGIRLKLHCRLALMTPESVERLESLERQGYPRAGMEEIFAFPLQNIGCGDRQREAVLAFFREASPHLLRIARSRRSLFESPDSGDWGGNSRILTLLDEVEQACSPL